MYNGEDIKEELYQRRLHILKGFGLTEEDILEKARQVGTTKVGADGVTRVWTQLPNGKFDWRRVKGSGKQTASDSQPKKEESKSTANQEQKVPDKNTISKLSSQELKEIKGINGTLDGEKGKFFKFKKDTQGRVVASFAYDEKTPSGFRKVSDGNYVEQDSVRFNSKIENIQQKNNTSNSNKKSTSGKIFGADVKISDDGNLSVNGEKYYSNSSSGGVKKGKMPRKFLGFQSPDSSDEQLQGIVYTNMYSALKRAVNDGLSSEDTIKELESANKVVSGDKQNNRVKRFAKYFGLDLNAKDSIPAKKTENNKTNNFDISSYVASNQILDGVRIKQIAKSDPDAVFIIKKEYFGSDNFKNDILVKYDKTSRSLTDFKVVSDENNLKNKDVYSEKNIKNLIEDLGKKVANEILNENYFENGITIQRGNIGKFVKLATKK